MTGTEDRLADATTDTEAVRAAVTSIIQRDPAFNLDTFLAEAQQAFWLVGHAHSTCQPELCETVLASDLAQRERATIEAECAAGTASAPEPQDASTGQLVSIETDAHRDTATVHFRSTWRRMSGRDHEERRSQNWCFQRASTALTTVTTESDRCHNCGAALQSSAGTCRYCGARIGDDAGWRVIRIDDVREEEVADAVTSMREVIAAAVAAARTASHESAPQPTVTKKRFTLSGCLTQIFWVVVVLLGVGVYAAFSDGTVHRVVATVVPPIKFAILKGPVDLNGRITAQHVSAALVQESFHHDNTCAKSAERTDWDFKAKLPDGSSFRLKIGLPPAAGGPGTYQRPKVSVNADAENKTSSVSWSSGPATTVTLTVRPDGGGDVVFGGLTSTTAGEGPLSGHLAWNCSRS